MPRGQPYPAEMREEARHLRREGWSLGEISAKLGPPKSTITFWVRDIELAPEHQARIDQKERDALFRSQPLGALWNKQQKQMRLQEAADWAAPIVESLVHNPDALMLFAAGLYLGEGRKLDEYLTFVNSDPTIVYAWITMLRNSFDIDEAKFACQLFISEGMNDEALREYWSSVTAIPIHKFHRTGVKRSEDVGKIRREGYKGVCAVTYYSAEVRRRIGALGRIMIDRINAESMAALESHLTGMPE